MAKQEEAVIKQVISFFQKFYRFPNYICVDKVKVSRDEIITLVERLIGKPFQWYKRRKVVGQLEDALLKLQQA